MSEKDGDVMDHPDNNDDKEDPEADGSTESTNCVLRIASDYHRSWARDVVRRSNLKHL